MNRILANGLLSAAMLLGAGLQSALASTDYGPAIWNAAATCNYQAGRSVAATHVTIHTTEGSYASTISWFKNCSASVSAHYVVRSSDGQITQMVREGDRAWHVGSENGYTVGIEHEGYVSAPSTWYTTAMYNSSSGLSRDILSSLGQSQRVYDGSLGWNAVLAKSSYNVKGHVNYPNQTHTDPGSGWDWKRYKSLVGGGGGGSSFTPGARGTVTGMNNLCVDVFGAATADGTKIGIYTCNSNTAQQWKTTTAHEVRNPLANKCMAVGNGGASVDGAPVVEWTCGGQPDQKWNFFNMEIVAGNSGKCVDVPNSNYADGQALQLFDCNGTAAQKITFETATGEIKSANGKCVDVAASNSNNGTVVQLWTCNGSAAQRWIPGNGGFRTALNTNRCMDLSGNGTTNGTRVQIWDCIANGPAQQFALRGEIKNQGGKCLDVPASNGVAGQALQLWGCNGAAAQRWTMWQPN
ncbi:hypothetical protein BH11PSE11_BH11PSE11_21250 [soil metagenome]